MKVKKKMRKRLTKAQKRFRIMQLDACRMLMRRDLIHATYAIMFHPEWSVKRRENELRVLYGCWAVPIRATYRHGKWRFYIFQTVKQKLQNRHRKRPVFAYPKEEY